MFLFLGGEGRGARGPRGNMIGYGTASSLSSIQHFCFLLPGEEGTWPISKTSLWAASYLHMCLWFPKVTRGGNPAKTTRLIWTEWEQLEMFTGYDCGWFWRGLDKNVIPSCPEMQWWAWTSPYKHRSDGNPGWPLKPQAPVLCLHSTVLGELVTLLPHCMTSKWFSLKLFWKKAFWSLEVFDKAQPAPRSLCGGPRAVLHPSPTPPWARGRTA